MTLSTRIEVFTDFTFVRCGPSYMHGCRTFTLRQLGFLVLPCNTVICGYSYCWNDEHLVTGISLYCGLVKSDVNVVKMPGDCRFNDNWTP